MSPSMSCTVSPASSIALSAASTMMPRAVSSGTFPIFDSPIPAITALVATATPLLLQVRSVRWEKLADQVVERSDDAAAPDGHALVGKLLHDLDSGREYPIQEDAEIVHRAAGDVV